ncbi:MAG: acetoacetate--CoA ligase [Nitrososphaerota archaeon]
MGKLLWRPGASRVEKANITNFTHHVNELHGLELDSYWQLYNWSVENIPEFWAAVWDFCNIKYFQRYERVVDDLTKFPGARWFLGAQLNFAENLVGGGDGTAIIRRREDGLREELSYSQLREEVANVAEALLEAGIVPGDRVAGYAPNNLESVVAMLAATSIGAIWSSCGTELGAAAVLDRFGQIGPRILFTVDRYIYKGRVFNITERLETIAAGVKSLERIVVKTEGDGGAVVGKVPNAIEYGEFRSGSRHRYHQLPFNHPALIMFTSGTTGKPKCMVQSSGGVLINHLKELILHIDLKPGDVITFITSPGWMMWNWLLSSLAVGATIVLYDGNPTHPGPEAMWRVVEEEKVTVFGCSATYINSLMGQRLGPRETCNLTRLREVVQTGSPLSPEGFEYVYKAVGEDIHFNSISGGTDINGCFAIGIPTLPVYAGQLQAPGLGMKVKAYDEDGNPVYDRPGELVCEAPSPSMPLYFWNDPDGSQYLEAYFNYFRSRRVWRHGDYVEFHSDTGGITFYGRSDATLKPSGVRIGTAEIYNVVERMPEIADSLAVGQPWKGDERVILFVKLAPGHTLSEELREKIRRRLREEASPRHVPAKIIEVADIPYTYNMKKVEIAVANILAGRSVKNRDAILNPESLDIYEKLVEQLRQD